VRFAMTEVARRRTDQLGDLMGVLEFGAVDLDAGAGVAEHGFRHSLNHASLAGTGRPQEQEVADGSSGWVEAGQKHLIYFRDLFDGLVLADDLAAEGIVKLFGVIAATGRVEHSGEVRSHRVF